MTGAKRREGAAHGKPGRLAVRLGLAAVTTFVLLVINVLVALRLLGRSGISWAAIGDSSIVCLMC